MVAGLLQDAKQIGLVGAEEMRQGPVTSNVGVPPGEERGAARRAHRMLDKSLGEARATLRQCVHVRGADDRVTEAPERVEAQLVWDEEDEVRSVLHRGSDQITLEVCVATGRIGVIS